MKVHQVTLKLSVLFLGRVIGYKVNRSKHEGNAAEEVHENV